MQPVIDTWHTFDQVPGDPTANLLLDARVSAAKAHPLPHPPAPPSSPPPGLTRVGSPSRVLRGGGGRSAIIATSCRLDHTRAR